MGFFSKLFSFFGKKKKVKIIVIGLDNSGKTTLIRWLKPKRGANFAEVTPTVGYNIETFSKNNIFFTIFDMAGKSNYRDMWASYLEEVDGIIVVIDSADLMRLTVLKNELDIVLENPSIKTKSAPILFFANKMDLKEAITPAECVDILKLSEINTRSWNICASNALTGEGIEQGSKWLVEKLSPVKK